MTHHPHPRQACEGSGKPPSEHGVQIPRKGYCPQCGGHWQVRNDGLLRLHRAELW